TSRTTMTIRRRWGCPSSPTMPGRPSCRRPTSWHGRISGRGTSTSCSRSFSPTPPRAGGASSNLGSSRRLAMNQLLRIREILQSAFAGGSSERGNIDPLARGAGGIAAFLRARGNATGNGFVDTIARDASTRDGRVSQETIQALLTDLLTTGSPPEALFTDETLGSAVAAAAAQTLSRNGTPVNPEDVRKAIGLLRSGQV